MEKARKDKEAVSLAYHGNVVELWEKLVKEDVEIDLGSDQTSLHNPYAGGYYPVGLSFEEANEMMVEQPEDFQKQGGRIPETAGGCHQCHDGTRHVFLGLWECLSAGSRQGRSGHFSKQKESTGILPMSRISWAPCFLIMDLDLSAGSAAPLAKKILKQPMKLPARYWKK